MPDTTNVNWIVYEKNNSGLQNNFVVESIMDTSGKIWTVANDVSSVAGNVTSFNGLQWDFYSLNQHKVYDDCGNLISSVLGNYLPNTYARTIC
jgi:hypothetical protein